MKRTSIKKKSNSLGQNEEESNANVRVHLSSNFHPARSYSEVVAFGIEERTPPKVTTTLSKLIPRKMSPDCPSRTFEAFPPLSDLDDENDVVILNDSGNSKSSELKTYGKYLETRFENDEGTSEVSLRSILNIEIDSFNFTEVDCDPDSSSFPRFIGVFEDKDYLKLENDVLKNCYFDRN